MSRFVHLHVHTQYSVLDGIGSSKQYAEVAKGYGQEHLCCSDHGNVDGALEHQKACKEAGIKPIIGCELYLVDNLAEKHKGETRYHITVLVENEVGWRNLLKMLTIANVEGFYHRPRIDPPTLLNHLRGLVVLTGCSMSFLNMPGGRGLLKEIMDKLGKEKVFLEIMPHDFDQQIKFNQKVKKLAQAYDLEMVATNDCHYPTKESAIHQEVLLAIQSRKKWGDKDRWRFTFDTLYLQDYDEIHDAFVLQGVFDGPEIKRAMRNSLRIAKICERFEIKQQPVTLPGIGVGQGGEELMYLWNLIEKGYEARIPWAIRDVSAVYSARIQEEFALIKSQRFEKYFLIVWDLVRWCKKNDILVGPGRGSVGGSLIAYLLGITDVDPIKFNLVFFRFISPDRSDLPDIDLDFEDHKRPLVRQYLSDKYGEFAVAGLSTFLTIRGKGALRDVARVFDVPLDEVDQAAKSMDDALDDKEQIKTSFAGHIEECNRFKHKYPQVVEIAQALEGQIRGVGQHAAAVCISSEDLRQGRKCNLAIRSGVVVSNWDKQNAEFMGLMKLDILGLSALSVLNEAAKMIKENHEIEIDYPGLPLDDKRVFGEIAKGNHSGVFQISAKGLSRYCLDLGVSNFELLAATTALYRPGPLHSGMAERFVKRKHGEEAVEKIHPIYDNITKSTLGIIVYQEQVMLVINQMAGIPMDVCNKIRGVMAKSKGAAALNKYQAEFVKGCIEQKTVNEKKAKEIWKTISTFGAYGFNRCLTGDTVVIRSSGNQYQPKDVTIAELFEAQSADSPWGAKIRRYGIEILQMDDDARVRPGKIKKIYDSGIQKTFELVTTSGKKIRATANHRFLTADGYKKVSNIKIGELLLCQGKKEQKAKVGPASLGKGKNYIGRGWQAGESNVCFIDGRTEKFRKAKKRVAARSGNKCESCSLENSGDKHFLEFAHIDSLESLGGDYSKYHNHKNIKHLCNSCHKKLDYQIGVRKRRWSKGLPIIIEQIVSIKNAGRQQTYDIEMDTAGHNFIANGIVSHNSHSVEYSMITYWDMHLKTYYPAEFIACSLTFGSKDQFPSFVREARRLKLKLRLPKVGISHATNWKADTSGNLFAPFISINGVGDAAAKLIAESQPVKKRSGFFSKGRDRYEIKGVNKSAIAVLERIRAWDVEHEFTEQERRRFDDLFSF